MKHLLLIISLFILSSCSCSKEDEKEPLTFNKAWTQYNLLCNFNIASPKRCSELSAALDSFKASDVSEATLQSLVQQCNEKQPSACVVLSWFFVRTKKFEAAVKFGRDFCPQSAMACFYVGEAYSNLNRLSEALPFLEKACEQNEATGCERIGHFYLSEQKRDGAIKYFRKACDLEESYGCYNLACVYSLAKNSKLSFEAFEEALQLGFEEWETIKTDKDLEYLKSQKDIPGLLLEYQEEEEE